MNLYYSNNNSKIVASARDLVIIEVSSIILEYNQEHICILYLIKSNFIIIIIKDLKLSV
jgi:hypothetical protein